MSLFPELPVCVRKSSSVCPLKYVGKREKLSLTKFLNQLVEYVQLVLVISVWEKNMLCNHTAWADVEWKMVIWTREDESVIKTLGKNPNYCSRSSSVCSSSKEKGKQERVSALKWEMRGNWVNSTLWDTRLCTNIALCWAEVWKPLTLRAAMTSSFALISKDRNSRCLGLACSIIIPI